MARGIPVTALADGSSRLRRARYLKGLSVARLAAEAGVGASTVSRAEHGRPITFEVAGKLTQALNRFPARPELVAAYGDREDS